MSAAGRRRRPGRVSGAAVRSLAGCAAALLATVASAPAPAQEPLAFELRGGVGLPAFDLADRADPGFAVGLDLARRVAGRFSVVVGGDLELLEGDDALADGVGGVASGSPDLNLWHYGAGVEAQLLDPARTYWRLSAGAGVGGTTFDAAGAGGSDTDLSTYGSLELGWDASEETDLFVGVRSWVAFVGDDGPGSGAAEADVLWSFPVTGGVRLKF